MTDTVARELRELAAEIEELARGSRVAGIAREQVSALADYLCLRARLIEIEGRSSPGALYRAPGRAPCRSIALCGPRWPRAGLSAAVIISSG